MAIINKVYFNDENVISLHFSLIEIFNLALTYLCYKNKFYMSFFLAILGDVYKPPTTKDCLGMEIQRSHDNLKHLARKIFKERTNLAKN